MVPREKCFELSRRRVDYRYPGGWSRAAVESEIAHVEQISVVAAAENPCAHSTSELLSIRILHNHCHGVLITHVQNPWPGNGEIEPVNDIVRCISDASIHGSNVRIPSRHKRRCSQNERAGRHERSHGR